MKHSTMQNHNLHPETRNYVSSASLKLIFEVALGMTQKYQFPIQLYNLEFINASESLNLL